MKNKCVWTDSDPSADSGNKTGGEESGWRVTDLFCSVAASTPSLSLRTNQKNRFLACQDPGMKKHGLPPALGFASSSQHVPCSCGRKGHTTALLPKFHSGPCKEQRDRDNHLSEELLTSGALRGYGWDQRLAQPLVRLWYHHEVKLFPQGLN